MLKRPATYHRKPWKRYLVSAVVLYVTIVVMMSFLENSMIFYPKLFIHSRSDEIVPYKLGRRLYAAAPEPKQFYEVVGTGHNETWLVGGEAYFRSLSNFLAVCNPAR